MTERWRLTAPLFDKLVAGALPQGLEGSDAATARFAVGDPDRFGERSLRESVRREVGWMLNTTQFGATVDLDHAPQVASSVLNYGVPELAGKAISHRIVLARARDIRGSLRAFEPRIDEHTLSVEPATDRERENAITFVIHADIRSAVQPVPLRLKTDVEADGGTVEVRE